jgi:hypothetical protein
VLDEAHLRRTSELGASGISAGFKRVRLIVEIWCLELICGERRTIVGHPALDCID